MSMILIDEATVKLALDYLNELIRGLKMDDESHAHQVSAALREALTSVPDWASEAREQPRAEGALAQQCKWPTCQSEEYQQALAEQIKRELVGEQPAQETDQSIMYTFPSKAEPIPYSEPIGILMKLKGDAHMKLYPLAEQQAQRTWVSLKNEEIDLLINGRGDEDDEDYVEPTGDGFGLTDSDLVQLVRRSEAKLKEKNT